MVDFHFAAATLLKQDRRLRSSDMSDDQNNISGVRINHKLRILTNLECDIQKDKSDVARLLSAIFSAEISIDEALLRLSTLSPMSRAATRPTAPLSPMSISILYQ